LVIIFWCFKQWITLFLQKMLFDPDPNITCENDVHPHNQHSSTTAYGCDDQIRLIHDSHRRGNRSDGTGWDRISRC
jgi:hypothetical protein